MWACSGTRHLAPASLAPCNRVEECLLAKIVRELPAPPIVLDCDGFVDGIAEAVLRLPSTEDVRLATDGSVTGESAAAITFRLGGDFALGVPGEDQAPYKAEVQAPGRFFVLVDCTSALDATRGCGNLRKVCDQFATLLTLRPDRGVQVIFHWVLSHEIPVPFL